MSPLGKIVIGILSAIMMALVVADARAENYSYAEIKIGTFTDACRNCVEPDGKLPTYVVLGHNWIINKNNDIAIEWQHRSNIDIGTLLERTHEYDRNGIFIRYRLKFNLFK